MTSHPSSDQPSTWVARFAPLVPQGEVLDLACGSGRHARHFAAMGYRVMALDRDREALSRMGAAGIDVLEHDLERPGASWPFESGRFAGIVVTNYLHRPLFAQILDSLAVGGVLIYETFAQGNEKFGKPSNPAFLLAPAELLEVARSCSGMPLRVIAFEDGYLASPKPAMVQRICALKTGPAALQPGQLRLFF